MTAKAIEACDVSLAFGATKVLDAINLQVKEGEIVVLVGPSGCGKTSLLNLLSGFVAPSTGSIVRNGPMRTVHQHSGLLPWLTVAENIALGLREMPDSAAKAQRIAEALDMIALREFRDHYPHQLSGGMRQRTELARALVSPAQTLLMDEPFSALDYMTRLRMRQELVLLLQRMPRTVVLVTHDLEEAAQLADRIVLLSDRPTTIRTQLQVNAPRPRSVTHPDVVSAVSQLLALLDLESQPALPERAPTRVSAPA